MTGKELALVLLVAGVAGGGAAVGAGAVTQQLAAPEESGAQGDQFARIEAALARISTEQEETRKSVATLNDRVTGLAMDVNTAREEARAASADTADAPEAEARPGRARRIPAAGEHAIAATKIARLEGDVLHLAREGLQLAGDAKLETAIVDAMGKRLQALPAGLGLRLLPEAERWQKAKTELNLSDAQVDEIKRAVADRDAAIKDAMDVQTTGEGSDQQITIRRMDPAKAASAQQEYERRVGSTLDQDQKKKWDEGGYGHAFGGPGGGRGIAIVHSVDVTRGASEEK